MSSDATKRFPHVPSEEVHYHESLDPHKESNLSDVILGGQDGLVNVLGVILGVAAATQDARIVLAAGLAATFAESVSMGAVAYTSTKADHDYYMSEEAREHRHIHRAPALEREEVRQIFYRRGFSGEVLEQIVDTITSDEKTWVSVMLTLEHKILPVDRGQAWKSAILVFTSALIGSLIPLAPFFAFSVATSIWISLGVSAITLFGVGAYKAWATVGSPARSGLEMTVIGTISALVGYAVGLLFQV